MNIEQKLGEAKQEIEQEMHATYVGAGKDGGKKLRGSLTVLICDCFGGDHEKAIRYGAAVEFIHSGSIVHDDILDDHKERRGRPSKMITEGIKKALLMGDMYFTKAIKIGAEGGSEEALAVANAMESVLGGAIKEVSMIDMMDKILLGDIEDELYYKIIDAKTAALFGCAAKFGAMTFTDDAEMINDFFEYGMLVGQSYQIADDLVDMIKMADGDMEINPVNVIPIIPAIIKYNKNVIKRLPFKMLVGRIDILSFASDGIADIDLGDKMIEDIRSRLKEAESIIENHGIKDKDLCVIKEYSKYAINKMLSEVGEKI